MTKRNVDNKVEGKSSQRGGGGGDVQKVEG